VVKCTGTRVHHAGGHRSAPALSSISEIYFTGQQISKTEGCKMICVALHEFIVTSIVHGDGDTRS